MVKLKPLCWMAGLTLSLLCGVAFAHAMPEQITPGADAVLSQAPATVAIRFNSELESVFSKLIVKDDAGKQVSAGNGSVDSSNAKLLTTQLNTAEKGRYHVYWSVVSRDGHRSEGDHTFTVK